MSLALRFLGVLSVIWGAAIALIGIRSLDWWVFCLAPYAAIWIAAGVGIVFLRHWGRRLSIMAAGLGTVAMLVSLVYLVRAMVALSHIFGGSPDIDIDRVGWFFAPWVAVLFGNIVWCLLFTHRVVAAQFRN